MEKKRKRAIRMGSVCAIAAVTFLQLWPAYMWNVDAYGKEAGSGAPALSEEQEDVCAAEISSIPTATISIAARLEETQDFWTGWNGNADFAGDGTEEKPYQIRSLAHLMGLSQAVAEGETFAGAYFELTQDINLGNLDIHSGRWNPIGWYRSGSEMETGTIHPFSGHFNGLGHTIRNLNITTTDNSLRCIGLFGVIDGGSVENLTVEAGNVCGSGHAAVLAGVIRNGAVIRDVTVSGYVSVTGEESGYAGGITAQADGEAGRGTVENCTADNIAVTASQADSCTGGIAGEAKSADLIDCVVQTGKINSNHIQGLGYVGGITGRMEDANLYNSYVNGLIGGHRSKAVGGIVGEYVSGNLILARFGGEISSTGMGAATREGTFVGTRDLSHPFRYGTEPGDHMAYLYADTAAKARQAVGSGEEDDNTFAYSAHVGYWLDNQRTYRLLSGNAEKENEGVYFYQELEDGVKHIITRKLQNEFTAQGATEGLSFRLDHFAPGQQGQPVKGYLLSVPRIDTRNANGTYDTDVASFTAVPEGNASYYRPIDKNHAAAVAAGVTVSVTTSPNNSDGNRYQMIVDAAEQGGVKPPVYINQLGREVPMSYVTGGTYAFTMPARDTQINVEYVKVTTELTMTPAETVLSVTQTRTGDRKAPKLVTEVRDGSGTLIARYIDDTLDAGVQVQPVRIHSDHNAAGGVADRSVQWSVDDPDLIELVSDAGYTEQDARILPNLGSAFLQKTLAEQVKAQADGGYMEAIQPAVYEKHAVVTAASNPATSVDHVSVYGNCKVTVRFQILDYTTRRVEGLQLNLSDVVLTVTRKLTGSRTNPTEAITCSEPVVLSASLYPEQPFYKNVTWSDSGSGAAIILKPQGANAFQCVLSPRYDAEGKANPAWIQNVINADNQKRKEDPYAKLEGTAEYMEKVTAVSEDQTHGRIAAVCKVIVRFETVDQTGSYGSGSYGSGSYGGGSYGGGSTGGTSYGSGSSSRSDQTAGPGIASAGAGSLGTAGSAAQGNSALEAVTGAWQLAADGTWTFLVNQQPYRARWAYVFNPYADVKKGQPNADWFYFNADGIMVTGWQWLAGADGVMRCYYFNAASDGTKGAMFHDITTPDGWQVNADGAWTVGGVVQTKPAA